MSLSSSLFLSVTVYEHSHACGVFALKAPSFCSPLALSAFQVQYCAVTLREKTRSNACSVTGTTREEMAHRKEKRGGRRHVNIFRSLPPRPDLFFSHFLLEASKACPLHYACGEIGIRQSRFRGRKRQRTPGVSLFNFRFSLASQSSPLSLSLCFFQKKHSFTLPLPPLPRRRQRCLWHATEGAEADAASPLLLLLLLLCCSSCSSSASVALASLFSRRRL